MVRRKFFVSMGNFEYTCTECGYKVDSKTGFKLHLKKSHPDTKKILTNRQIFDCKFCSTVFSNEKEMIKHLKTCNARKY